MDTGILPPDICSRERFETSFTIASYESDFKGNLSLFAILNRFQELAGLHARFLQVGYDLYHHSNLAWFLSRIKMLIYSLPRWGDIVTLATWPKGIEGLFALRDFSIRNTKGDILVLGTSAWIIIDSMRNRPQRIDRLPVDLQFKGAPDAISDFPEKIQPPPNLLPIYARKIVLSDIDSNGHVNNAHHIKWICDSFPKDQFLRRVISSIQINYLQEALPEDSVELFKSADEHTEIQYIVGRSQNNESTLFNSLVQWK